MTNKIQNILAAAMVACITSSGFAAPYVYDEDYSITVNGAVAGEKQGFSAAVLDDVNGDGYKDFAVSAPYATVSSLAEVGKVYIRSGKTGAVLTTIAGVADINTRFGWSLANAGDVNGDGKSDLLVGSPYEDSTITATGINDVGAVRVYSGSTLTVATPTVLKTIKGTVIGQNLGYALAGLGDINVIATTATLASTNSTSLKVASLANVVIGQQVIATGISGFVTVTAINTGTLTVTLSAPATVALNATVNFLDGKSDYAYSVLGQKGTATTATNLTVAAANSTSITVASVAGIAVGYELVATTTTTNTVPVTGWPASVKVLNIVGNELTLSAPITLGTSPTANPVRFFPVQGMVSIYNGGTGALIKNLTGAVNTGFGQSVAGVMDMNADGRRDLVVGSPLADRVTPTAAIDAGKAELFVSLGVAGTAVHKTVWGLAAEDQLGYQVASAGTDLPINDGGNYPFPIDGVGDFLVSAPYANTANNINLGAIYMVSGATGVIFNTITPQGQPGEADVQFGKNGIAYMGPGYGNLYIAGMPMRAAMGVVNSGSVGIFNEVITELSQPINNGDWTVGATENDNAGQAVAGPADGKIGDGECPLFLYTTPGFDVAGVVDAGQIAFIGDCDTDGDNLGDRTDKWPSNPRASVDTDGDGFPDAWTQYAIDNNLCQATDLSCDGLFLDAIPQNDAAYLDSDHDGMPDSWIPGNSYGCAVAASICNGLTLDLDDDNDRLSDVEEAALFTDPFNPLDPPRVSAGDDQWIWGLDDPDFNTSVEAAVWGWWNDEGLIGHEAMAWNKSAVATASWAVGGIAIMDNTGVTSYAYDFVPMLNGVKLSGYARHLCALSSTEGVKCFGSPESGYDYGQLLVPERFTLANPSFVASSVVDVAAGKYHSCALDAAGIECWGDDSYNQKTVPALTSPTAVAAGDRHTCAIDNNGTHVSCWGDPADNKLQVPTSVTSPLTITAGSNHTCVINGSYLVPDQLDVICWGRAQVNGVVAGLDKPVSVSAGATQTCAIQANGQTNQPIDTLISCWPKDIDFDGDGIGNSTDDDDDGDGVTDTADSFLFDTDNDGTKNALDLDDDADTVLDDSDNCSFVANTDQLDNDDDLKGDACDLDDDNDDLTDIEEAAAGSDPLLADTDGDSMDDFYEVNHGLNPSVNDIGLDLDGDTLVNIYEFTLGTNPANVDSDFDTLADNWEEMYGRNPLQADYQVSAGEFHTCALDDSPFVNSSRVSCWGLNDNGQINVPTTLKHPIEVSAGGYHSCAIDVVDDTNGYVDVVNGARQVKCWGATVSNFGQAPSVVPDLVHPLSVSAGWLHTCALDEVSPGYNEVKCWGYNSEGATNVPALQNPVQVSSRGLHSCALDDSGMHCWGRNDYGQTIVPELSNIISIDTNFFDSCALHDKTQVTCWGADGGGAGSLLAAASAELPFTHFNGTPPKTGLGWLHSCAINADNLGVNTLYCYTTNNYYGVLDIPANNQPVQISSGMRHSCALDNGGVFCWGAGGAGETTRGDDHGQSDVPELNFDIYRYVGNAFVPLLNDENYATAFFYDYNADGNLDVSFENDGQPVMEYGTAAGSFLFPTVGQVLDPATNAEAQHLLSRLTFGATPDLLLEFQNKPAEDFILEQLNESRNNDELYLALANWLKNNVFPTSTHFSEFTHAIEYHTEDGFHNVYRSSKASDSADLVWVRKNGGTETIISAHDGSSRYSHKIAVDATDSYQIWLAASAATKDTPISNTVDLLKTADLTAAMAQNEGLSPSVVDLFIGPQALNPETVGMQSDYWFESPYESEWVPDPMNPGQDMEVPKVIHRVQPNANIMLTLLNEFQMINMLHSKHELQEVLTWFWENHFNTTVTHGGVLTMHEIMFKMQELPASDPYSMTAIGFDLQDRIICNDNNGDDDCLDDQETYAGLGTLDHNDAWDALNLNQAHGHITPDGNITLDPNDYMTIAQSYAVTQYTAVIAGHVDARRVQNEYRDNKLFRAHALGNFKTLLADSMTSPGMMQYLSNQDNNMSSCNAQPNQNYGREILQLHTLGTDAGYTEGASGDVQMVSEVLTGWRGDGPNIFGGYHAVDAFSPEEPAYNFFDSYNTAQRDKFKFSNDIHDCYSTAGFKGFDDSDWIATTSIFKDQSIAATSGVAEGQALQDLLAYSPHTARYICSKLGQLLVADNVVVNTYTGADAVTEWGSHPLVGTWRAPAVHYDFVAPVEACYVSYMTPATKGDIKAAVGAMIQHPDFSSAAYQHGKIKTPLELNIAMIRNLKRNWVDAGIEIDYEYIDASILWMGMDLFGHAEPTGWDEIAAKWLSVEDMRLRLSGVMHLLHQTPYRMQYWYSWIGGPYAPTPDAYTYASAFKLLGARTGADVYLLLQEMAMANNASASENTHVSAFTNFELTDPDADYQIRQLMYYVYSSPSFQRQ